MEVHAQEYECRAEMVADCAKYLKVQEKSVRDKLNRSKKYGVKAGTRKKGGRSGISKEQFRAQFDTDTATRQAIRQGLKSIGKSEILADNQFRSERCGNVGTAGWRQIAEEVEFIAYQFRCGGRIWWATSDTVEWSLVNVSKAKEL
jgi:hypothetical protein